MSTRRPDPPAGDAAHPSDVPPSADSAAFEQPDNNLHPRTAVAAATTEASHGSGPRFKDQCRSVTHDSKASDLPYRQIEQTRAANTNKAAPPSTIPLATEVVAIPSISAEDPSFVFQPSNPLVEALEGATTHKERVKAVRDICFAAKETNPRCIEESRKIVAAGGVHAIIAVMKSNPKAPDIQEFACGALWNLSATDDSAASLGLSEILKAMKALPMASGVQRQACGVLRNLTENNLLSKKVANAGGIAAILTAMRNHPDASQVHDVACGALANLAEDNAVLLCQQGAVADVVAAMKSHLDVESVQEQACLAIWLLAANHQEGKIRIRRDGAIPAVQAAMARHPTNATIQSHGSSAIEELAK